MGDAPGSRLRALDVFRGATVALMILVNNPGNWGALYLPLAHAPWHGVTPTDLVFPFFLFAVGNALALVMPGLRAAGPAAFWPRIAKRTLLIFAIGVLLNAAPFVRWDAAGDLVLRDWHTLRLMGVLQRIALCFGAAAALVWWLGRHSTVPVLGAAGLLLAGYWLACETLGTPGDVYSLQGWFGTAVDRALLGESHLYRGEGVPFDPEGLASTAPAVAQVLLGWWVGRLVQAAALDAPQLRRLCLQLCAWAAGLLVVALLWQMQMPVNKKIWTSSYVLLSTALALGTLALCLWLVEIRGRAGELAGWARSFEAFGRNPLFIFVLSGLVPRLLALLRWPDGLNAQGEVLWTSPMPWAYRHLFADIGQDLRLGSFLFALANLALYAALAWWLDRRRLYFRV